MRPSLDRVRDVVALVLLAGFLSTMISATIGVASLAASGLVPSGRIGTTWRIWWLGDLGGDLIVAPALLVLASHPQLERRRWMAAEGGGLFLVLLAVNAVAFAAGQPITYAIFPVLFWIAYRFRQAGIVIAGLVTAATAVWFTSRGQGPFVGGGMDTELLRSQSFVGVATITGLLVAALIAERERAERSHEYLASIVESSHDAIIGKTLEGTIISWNEGAEEVYGYRAEEVIGKSIRILAPPEREDEIPELLKRIGRGERVRHHETERRRKDGRRIHVSLSLSPTRDAAGEISGASVVARDITERRRTEQRLRHRAEHDPLTGLFNRRRFTEELERWIAQHARYGDRGAVLLVDIDHFKRVNDTLGHAAGDELIARVGQLLRRRLRKTDAVGRWGGDEFTVLLPRASQEQALSVARELLREVRETVSASDGEQTIGVTVSIGVAPFGVGANDDPERALRAADAAMYRAKVAGRDRVEWGVWESVHSAAHGAPHERSDDAVT